MCGVGLLISPTSISDDSLTNCLAALRHRGPDDEGLYIHRGDTRSVALVHTRLSILDLSARGHQPMRTPSGIYVSFNGEIYNESSLRDQLKRAGHVFSSGTDTEVILKAYEQDGVRSFAMLRGMFAFALLDTRTQRCYLVRDRLGIKPFYYSNLNGKFAAASEIRALRALSGFPLVPDENDIYEFFNQGFLYEPRTGYKDVRKLLPGSFCEIDINTGECTNTLYATPSDDPQPERRLDELVLNSVADQQRADVKTGVFFSGGLDSTVVAIGASNAPLLFAEYEADSRSDSDRRYALRIGEHLNKTVQIVQLGKLSADPAAIMASVDIVAKNTEELISDYTFWATYQLALRAREAGFKVMLSGMGGDEVFGGYPRYRLFGLYRMLRKIRYPLRCLSNRGLYPESFSKRFDRLVSFAEECDLIHAYMRLVGYFSRAELQSLFRDFSDREAIYSCRLRRICDDVGRRGLDPLRMVREIDLKGFLAHNLMVADKASMLAGLELRVPFLSEDVVSTALRLPPGRLLSKSRTKLPLHRLAATRVPPALLSRPKVGFNPPLDNMINFLGRKRIESELDGGLPENINRSAVFDTVAAHFEGGRNNTFKIWQLLYFGRWMVHANNP